MSLVFSLLLVFLDVSEKYLTMEQEVSLIHFYPRWNTLINFLKDISAPNCILFQPT